VATVFVTSTPTISSVDPDTVISQMRKVSVDDFFAHGAKCEDGRLVHDMYLMRIKPEESKQRWDPTNISRPRPATMPFARWPRAAAPIWRNRLSATSFCRTDRIENG
jgi:branched-chain amino acid transport system substrate-binding protein